MNSSCCKGKDYIQDTGASLVFWYVPMGLAIAGFMLSDYQNWMWPVAFAWSGFGCLVNANSCKRVHCTFTGPLYLLVAILGIASSLSWKWLWALAVAGTVLSFLPEWRGKKYWSEKE